METLIISCLYILKLVDETMLFNSHLTRGCVPKTSNYFLASPPNTPMGKQASFRACVGSAVQVRQGTLSEVKPELVGQRLQRGVAGVLALVTRCSVCVGGRYFLHIKQEYAAFKNNLRRV